jgi:hypothetical protein
MFALSAAAVIAGLIVALTVGSMLAPILIIGGVAALGVMMTPAAVDRVAHFLSTGSWRRW